MIKRNIRITITTWFILFFVLLAIINDGFAKNDSNLRREKNKSANDSAKSLLMVEMPQGVILGRPTDASITMNVYAHNDMEFYIEYGLSSSKYDHITSIYKLSAGHARDVTINDLKPDSKYYYHILRKETGEKDLTAAQKYSFHTCQSKGNGFCFVVQADSHLDEQSSIELYKRTLSNALSDNPDFMIDLGDTFMSDKLHEINQANIINRHLIQRGFFSLVSHSVPLYLVLGNHDGESGWKLDGTENNIAVWAANARMTHFPNPIPDDFYSGNTTIEKFVGLPENYYAWTWGDALFVVLDPYRYTAQKPGRTVDNWEWTLGDKQYNWFKNVLKKSDSRFKFVFCHQLIGGGDTEGRGGAEFAKYYEMGGFNKDDTWGFDVKRPGWEKPIHQLLVENNVTVFFHGHDHFFAKQALGSVIYQLVPQPSHPNFKNAGQADSYGYTTGDILPNSGHLRVTVSADSVKVDYVRSYLAENETGHRKNGEVAHSYTIQSK
jgi:predicted phosphodiesterase